MKVLLKYPVRARCRDSLAEHCARRSRLAPISSGCSGVDSVRGPLALAVTLLRAGSFQAAEREYVSPWRSHGRCVRDSTSIPALSKAGWGAQLTSRSRNVRKELFASFPQSERNLPAITGGRSALLNRDRGVFRCGCRRRTDLGIASASNAHGGRNGRDPGVAVP